MTVKLQCTGHVTKFQFLIRLILMKNVFLCYRPVETPQSYNKSGTQPSQTSRSAASPLSPPRPGGAATTYPQFSSGVPAREAPVRYAYGTIPYRENPYARVPQVPQQVKF